MVAYLWVFLGGPIHQLAHIQKEQICDEEESACHLTVVHSDSVNGCEHEYHFAKYQVSCDLCALFQGAFDSDLFNQGKTTLAFKNNADHPEHYPGRYLARVSSFDSRGPPMNS